MVLAEKPKKSGLLDILQICELEIILVWFLVIDFYPKCCALD